MAQKGKNTQGAFGGKPRQERQSLIPGKITAKSWIRKKLRKG